MMKRFPTVFEDTLGKRTQATTRLILKPGANCVLHPKRQAPIVAMIMVEDGLIRLEQMGILQPVAYSKWAAPIVVIRKANGHSLHDPEWWKFLREMDLSDAYLQVEVEPENHELLTINTHRGLFQYIRLPLPIKTAPAIFQHIIHNMISGLEGTAAHLKDIIVVGESEEKLQGRVEKLLERIEKYGFHLLPNLC
ncbi:unnamed protein product [Hymenolepis diminuta]|uniref:Reverse transcriptase domain-containing protein n=1 Tax=Hymenolepis diminuta TaxID=6216 RepID=A0A0R3SYZ7_HYMDI|nr:unnamed protein product [Hymenolepis diminuta]